MKCVLSGGQICWHPIVYIRVSPFDISFGPSLKQLLSISVILYVRKLLIAVFWIYFLCL